MFGRNTPIHFIVDASLSDTSLRWKHLIHPPPATCVRDVRRLVARVDTPAWECLESRVQRDTPTAVSVLAALPHLTVVGTVQDLEARYFRAFASPARGRVLSMLRRRGPRRRICCNVDAETADGVAEIVEGIIEWLRRRSRVSFAVAYLVDGDPLPQFVHDGDGPDERRWQRLLSCIPGEDRRTLPAAPPPTLEELQRPLIHPATPSTILPEGAITSGIRWHEYQRYNPVRPPDWRWTRAWSIVHYGRYYSRKRDDGITGRLVRFFRGLLRQEETLLPYDERPDLVAAQDLWKNGGLRRCELESRILARQSDEEIAARLKIAPGAVQAYADTFFDVRPRLNAKTYISTMILGTAAMDAGLEPLTEWVARSLAYFGGARVLDFVLPWLRDGGMAVEKYSARGAGYDPVAAKIDLLFRSLALKNADFDTVCRLRAVYPELVRMWRAGSKSVSYLGAAAQIVPPIDASAVGGGSRTDGAARPAAAAVA